MKLKRVLSFVLSTGLILNSISPYAGAAVIADEIEMEMDELEEVVTEEMALDDVEETDAVLLEASDEAGDDDNEANIDLSSKILARFDFENLTAANAEIVGDGAKATGTYNIIAGAGGKGKAVSLNVDNGAFKNTKQFLSVTKSDGSSLMTGLDRFTISFDYKQINKSSANWPIFLNRDVDSPEGKQNYIGTFLNAAGKLDVERYYNNDRANGKCVPSAQMPTDDWVRVDIVEDNGYAAIYKNGSLASSKNFETEFFKVSDILGTSSIFNIGKATWGGGEYMGGYIDNVTVYDAALSDSEIAGAYNDYLDSLIEKDESKKAIVHFDFDNLVTPDADIIGDGAVASGTYSIAKGALGRGKGLKLNKDGDADQFLKVSALDGGVKGLDEITVSYDYNLGNAFSVEGWSFYLCDKTNPTSQALGAKYWDTGYHDLWIRNASGTSSAYGVNVGGARDVVNQWIHIDYTIDSSGKYSLYKNGSLTTTKTNTKDTFSKIFGTNETELYIGKSLLGDTNVNFSGYIDNFTVYNYALSGAEITRNYNAFVNPPEPTTPNEAAMESIPGYVYKDFELPATVDGKTVTGWNVTGSGIAVDGSVAKVTRGSTNSDVTLTATTAGGTKDYSVVVLKDGSELATYTISDPIEGQNGGMVMAKKEGVSFNAIHSNQPVMYTDKGNKSYVSPVVFRKADGSSFGMIASDGGTNTILLYDSEDGISFTNEREIALIGANSVKKLDMVYDKTDDCYYLYVVNKSGTSFALTVTDIDDFTISDAGLCDHVYNEASNAPKDAVYATEVGLTQDEFDTVVAKYTNPHATKIEVVGGGELTKQMTVETPEDFAEELSKINDKVKITYSNGESHVYGLHFNQADVESISNSTKGTYNLKAYIGGDSYVIDADDPLIPERADPYITYDSETGYYYFTASYPMNGGSDKDGYDRLVLRRAKTVTGLADAEEITIWDENTSSTLGRFIWAPEIHKINGSWYFVATAGLNSSSTSTSFNIRPFMIKFNGTNTAADNDDFINPAKWGEPTLVKAYNKQNILAAMSLDMTYFEANGHHYLVWPDETKNATNPSGVSSIYIAETNPDDPTQLISEAKLLTEPTYTWEKVRYTVNEGPAVIKKDGKVYVCFSAAGTGSEYCVGYVEADETADLLDMDNWRKNPYPILTSGDFDDKLSGPGHNSFTVNENGEPIIVFHARPAETHKSHSGDPLYDPCRHAYIRPVHFDTQGAPILNLSDTEFAGEDGSAFNISVTIVNDNFSLDPVFELEFDETLKGNEAVNTAADSGVSTNAIIHGKPCYVQDPEYGQVLYLDGDASYEGSNSYLELPKGAFDGKTNITLSMDVNEVTRNHNYFTFAVGKDASKYLFYRINPTSMKMAIKKSNEAGEKVAEKAAAYPNNVRDWVNIKLVATKNSLSIYRNGELYATTTGTSASIADLGTNLVSYIGKSFYSSDIYMRGYFDNIRLYEYAMNADQVKAAYEVEEAERKEMLSQVAKVASEFEIPNADDIRGNITLPSEIDGVKIDWTSSNESVISTKEVENAGYDNTPAGVVTRQAADTKVTLKAVFSKAGQESDTKTYEVTVKAAPKAFTDEDYQAYLFVHFFGDDVAGSGGSAEREQTYFSTSRDGFNWVDLNENKPVLKSSLGESGVRDHYIGRSAEGDKFYMIATDLSIYHGDNWGGAGANGSHSIVVWESTDLVNWSEPWLAEIGPWLDENDNPGCTWAPEFIYDEKTGEYVVYFSSTHLEVDDAGKITQDYENHSIYYCKTRDFRNFTESKLYHSGGKDASGKRVKVIDSTMIKDGSTYYRFTKNESRGIIELDKSDAILGEFTEIPSKSLTTDVMNSVGAVEGPIIYKLNEKDEDGNNQWCLLVDRFAKAQGYYPLVTTDLSSGVFRQLSATEYSMPTKYRHGYVMSITNDEYIKLNEKWGDQNLGNVTTVEKSKSGNPMLGFDENGKVLYGGDPSILVDGDTVYAYVGQDTSTNESYNMPDWKCYSSTDMKNWKYESTILTCNPSNVSWAHDSVSAWAGQVVKHNDKYYFYYCTEANSANGSGKAIGVAVSDSPKGPFKDIGHPLVKRTDTEPQTNNWDDIDPTFWIETDEDGVEHRVLGWGNSRFYNCELNEDMISIKDRDGVDGISCAKASENSKADIKEGVISEFGNHVYTEAPYYYRQQDENGKYFGYYYMFFATDWREQMAYAYAKNFDEFINNEWTFGGVLMEPSATANTNHMAVFDFKGHTYFVYHDGSLAHGSGFRRVACVEEISVNSDGTIDPIRKTATGLTGTLSTITDADGNFIAAETFDNTLNDSDYPMVNKNIVVDYYQDGYEAGWEINPGKMYSKVDEYISIESDYKPGMYISAGIYNTSYTTTGSDAVIPVYLAQDANGSSDEAARMTFRTLKGLLGEGITFESVKYPGFYLANRGGKLILAKTVTNQEATFEINVREQNNVKASVQKTKRMYTVGQSVNTDDIRVLVETKNGYVKLTDVTTNVAYIDMSSEGTKLLKVTYTYEGRSYTESVKLTVVSAEYGR